MRILFVGYQPFYESGMMQMYCFANELSRLGHQVLALVPPDSRCRRISESVELMDEPPLFRLEEIKFKGPLLSSESRREVRAFEPDIIHAWTPRHIPASVVLQLRRYTEARLIVHCQDNEEYLYGLHLAALGRRVPCWWLRRLARPPLHLRMLLRPLLWPLRWQVKHPLSYRLINKAADCFTAHNPPLQREIQRRFPDRKVHLLYTGVDLDRFDPQVDGEPIRQQLGLDGRKVVMYTGSIDLPNLLILMRSVMLAKEKHPELAFVFVGTDHLCCEHRIKMEIQAMSMEKDVLFPGLVEHRRIHEYMAAADILVQYGQPGPYNDVRLPGKLIEYMAMGKPMITYGTGIGEIFEDGIDALTTARGDAAEIAQKLDILLSNEPLAGQMGANARKKAEELFDWGKNARYLAEIYGAVRAD